MVPSPTGTRSFSRLASRHLRAGLMTSVPLRRTAVLNFLCSSHPRGECMEWMKLSSKDSHSGKSARGARPPGWCESGTPVPLANELRDSRIRFRQGLLIGQEHDSEVLCAGLLAEAGAVDDHHMLLADEFLDEDFIALGDVDARVRVESATRCHATYPRSRRAPFLREIAAGA